MIRRVAGIFAGLLAAASLAAAGNPEPADAAKWIETGRRERQSSNHDAAFARAAAQKPHRTAARGR